MNTSELLTQRPELDLPPTAKSVTHFPVKHSRILSIVSREANHRGHPIDWSHVETTHNHERLFALGRIGEPVDGRVLQIGLRNSHDQRFPVGLVYGSQVLVCSNLCFFGEHQLSRRHTRRILEHLPGLTETAMGRVLADFEQDTRRQAHYRKRVFCLRDADHILMTAARRKVLPVSWLVGCRDEFYIPSHIQHLEKTNEFANGQRSAWTLLQAVTEIAKRRRADRGTSINGHISRLANFVQILDKATNFN